jgi:nicotinamidase-related amidase
MHHPPEWYDGWRPSLLDPVLRRDDTALLVIDMQYGDAHPDYGILRQRRDRGYGEGVGEYVARLQTVISNIQRIQEAFRARRFEVMFTRIRSVTRDGRDRSPTHKQFGYLFPPGSREAEILEELAPRQDEIIFDKTSGGVFNSTNIHYVLQNMHIQTLVLVGVVTSGCVESAARAANDLGYDVIVVEDGCAAYTQEFHEYSIRVMRETYAKIRTTEEVLRALHDVPVVA